MCDHFKQEPDAIPCSTRDDRYRYPNAIYHVAISSKTVPFGLAIRMIKVFTIGPSNHVCKAWALPHMEDALQNIHQTPALNPYSYYHHRHEHPENQFIKQASPPVSDDNTGELTLDNLTLVDAISGNSSSSSRDSGLNLIERDNDKFNPVNGYFQQTPSSFLVHTMLSLLFTLDDHPFAHPLRHKMIHHLTLNNHLPLKQPLHLLLQPKVMMKPSFSHNHQQLLNLHHHKPLNHPMYQPKMKLMQKKKDN
jgi:hypothetical protein